MGPTPTAAPGLAAADVHVLVCQRDAALAVLAVSSLLHHADVPLSVVFTDDGSLTAKTRSSMAARFPDASWLPRVADTTDVRRVLAGRPHLAALYESPFSFARRLVHPFAVSASTKVIQLDADTLFFHAPTKLLSWVRTGGPALFLHDHQDEAATIPALVRDLLGDLVARERGGPTAWPLSHYLFNAGLLAFRPSELDLDVAERFLAWRTTAPAAARHGRPAIWFGDWTQEQTAFLLMFACLPTRPEPLGADYHLGCDPSRAFNHFMRHYLVQSRTLAAIRTEVRALADGRRPTRPSR